MMLQYLLQVLALQLPSGPSSGGESVTGALGACGLGEAGLGEA